MLAITQPLRVGDWVTFDDQYGVVEDVRLNYTVLRTRPTRALLIPNEKLASGIIRNDTLESAPSGPTSALWLPPAPTPRARSTCWPRRPAPTSRSPRRRRRASGWRVGGDPVPPPERARHEAELRLRCLRRLQAEGLLADDRSSAARGETATGSTLTGRAARARDMSRSQRHRRSRRHRGGGWSKALLAGAVVGILGILAASRSSSTSSTSPPPRRRWPR